MGALLYVIPSLLTETCAVWSVSLLGALHVMVLASTYVAGTMSSSVRGHVAAKRTLSVFALRKPAPRIVSVAPPSRAPWLGDMLLRIGGLTCAVCAFPGARYADPRGPMFVGTPEARPCDEYAAETEKPRPKKEEEHNRIKEASKIEENCRKNTPLEG